jgi:16S rRNA (cytidine1402-2'-O)-methyltransferase
MGTLFLVATPIGNLEDITARALRVLREVPLIAAEDTRHSGRLLAHFGIETPMVSYHAHNERARRDRLLAALERGDVALVTDAGSPGISDPGRDLVAAALAAGHRVSPVPGPSSVVAAAGASGLVEGPFLVLGFLPRKGEERRGTIARAGRAGVPVLLFEAPGRLAETLDDLAAAWGDRPAVVLRELTKRHEEIRPGTLRELAAAARREPPRGEIVVVVGAEPEATANDGADAAEVVASLRRAGLSPSQAAREAAAVTGLPRSALYELARRHSPEGGGDEPAAGDPSGMATGPDSAPREG